MHQKQINHSKDLKSKLTITRTSHISAMMVFISHTSLSSVFIIFCCLCLGFATATDTITSNQFIKDHQTLSSNNGRFTLGFFSPENSDNRYVGIWYMSKSTVIWVANRNQPLRDTSGSFTIFEDGNLVVLNATKQVIWSSNVSSITTNSSSQLQDSGNLVLVDNTGTKVWESFQHPTDTWLPNMKITRNKRTGEEVRITSWKSHSDPSIGNFSLSFGTSSVPEGFVWNGTRPFWRTGPWNGQVFTGIPQMNSSYLNGYNVGDDGNETSYITFSYANESYLAMFVLNWQGKFGGRNWNAEKKEWEGGWNAQTSECDVYGTCGAFGICSSESSPICSCMQGFEPRNKEEWNEKNWASGCVRRTALQCETGKSQNGTGNSKGDGFLRQQMVKVPDFAEWSWVRAEDECRSQCLRNCNCFAYSYDAGIGCMSWSGNLVDTQQFTREGIDLYIRLANSDLPINGKKRDVTTIITVTVIIGVLMILTGAYFLWKLMAKKRMRKGFSAFRSGKALAANKGDIGELSEVEIHQLLLFDAEKLAIATNNFDSSNKLGQGGFGAVYKGTLQDGQEIAIKKLSRTSGQGLAEFMNEVVVISKLQHRNLVRLLGCCREGDEKMLIYEYMPNKSLDTFVFGPPEHKFLDWKKRFSVIEGIARGLLYLHRDSRLRIIHRDLKASNILLDEELNPKISDFGLARIFGGPRNEAITNRVVGTYGYMAPEYAIGGLISEKSDVFSFGVLLLEIVSGRRNSSFYNDQSLSLLGFAWKLWDEGNVLSLIDSSIYDPIHEKEVIRCVHIGLLCTQESARNRPGMATIISMLNSEIVNLAPPEKPAFFLRQNMLSSSSSVSEDCQGLLFSNNSATITEIQGR